MTNNHYSRLQTDILRLEGFKNQHSAVVDICLGEMRHAFPNQSFPIACVHEFLTSNALDNAASCGFLSAVLSSLTGSSGVVIWVGSKQKIFPNALKSFGVQPHNIVFVNVQKEADARWVMNEALKCSAVTAVVGELNDVSFNESRRLQLAVEESRATGFIIRNARKTKNSACVSRWKISPLASKSIDDLPGPGFPRWKAELLRMRNGRPGCWEVQWINGQFAVNSKPGDFSERQYDLKAG